MHSNNALLAQLGHVPNTLHCWVSGVKSTICIHTVVIATHCQPRRQQKQESSQSGYRCLTAWDASRILGLWGTGPWVCRQTCPRLLHARRRACVVSCHSGPNGNFWGWTSTSDGLIRWKEASVARAIPPNRRLATRNDWTRSHRPLTEILAGYNPASSTMRAEKSKSRSWQQVWIC